MTISLCLQHRFPGGRPSHEVLETAREGPAALGPDGPGRREDFRQEDPGHQLRREQGSGMIAILVCSNFALQICKLTANLTRQECNVKQVCSKFRSHLGTNLQQACRKLALQIIAKTEYEHNPG
ncbi:hypothetical protein AVEN_30244-1 [Araneus ventricosus]|uniref:Uncharacterized protein n=1 Tax=Araneus ventricosus TaxID=182803 RepID=A0A4Y2UG25_ARAVE|nr:hypothetical protein AVEN_30244-1 [Araneus ventricosus]